MTLLERKVIAAHLNALAQLPCVVTGQSPVTLHHCHGGSLKDAGIHRGKSQRPSDFLVIPIVEQLHTGALGIDGGLGVRTWEFRFGRQMDHLHKISRFMEINVFALSGYDIELPADRRSIRHAGPAPMVCGLETDTACDATWGGYRIHVYRSGQRRPWYGDVRTPSGRMAFEGLLPGSGDWTARRAACAALARRWV